MGLLLKPPTEDALERAARGLMSLTLSEYFVLRALLAGMKSDEIAVETGLTKLTVQFYLKTIFKKCGCDRINLVRMAPKLERNEAVASHLRALAAGARPSPAAFTSYVEQGQGSTNRRADDGRLTAARRRPNRQSLQRRPFKPHRAT